MEPTKATITVFDRKHAKLLEDAQKAYIESLNISDKHRKVAEKELMNLPKQIEGLVNLNEYSNEFQKIVFNALNDQIIHFSERAEKANDSLNEIEEKLREKDETEKDDYQQYYSKFIDDEVSIIEESKNELKSIEESIDKIKVLFDVDKLDISTSFVSVLKTTQDLNQPVYNNVNFFKHLLSTQNICDDDKKECLTVYAKYLCNNLKKVPTNFSEILEVVKKSDEEIDKRLFFKILADSAVFHKDSKVTKTIKTQDSVGEALRKLMIETCNFAIKGVTQTKKSLESYLNEYEDTGDAYHDRDRTEGEIHDLEMSIEILEDLNKTLQKFKKWKIDEHCDELELFKEFLKVFDQTDRPVEERTYALCASIEPFSSKKFEASPGTVILGKLIQNKFDFNKETRDKLLCAYIDVIGDDGFLRSVRSITGFDILDQLQEDYVAELKNRMLEKIETGDDLYYLSINPILTRTLLNLPSSEFDRLFDKYCKIYSEDPRCLTEWIKGDVSRIIDLFARYDASLIRDVERVKARKYNTENLFDLVNKFTKLKDESKIELYCQLLDNTQLKEAMKTYIDLGIADKVTKEDIQKASKQKKSKAQV